MQTSYTSLSKLLIDVQTIKNSMIMLNNIHSYEFDTLRHIYNIHICMNIRVLCRYIQQPAWLTRNVLSMFSNSYTYSCSKLLFYVWRVLYAINKNFSLTLHISYELFFFFITKWKSFTNHEISISSIRF